MVVALWEGQAAPPRLGGLPVSETKELQMAMMREGAKRGYATRTKRRRDAPKEAAK